MHVLRARCMVACQRFYGQSTQILRMVTSVPRIYLSLRGNGLTIIKHRHLIKFP